MIKFSEIDGRKAFLLPNGKELGKLATAAIASIVKDDFFPKPKREIYLLSLQLLLTEAEVKLKLQAEISSEESQRMAYARNAIDMVRKLIEMILDPQSSYGPDSILDKKYLQNSSIPKCGLRDTLINYVCFIDMAMDNEEFLREMHNETVSEVKTQELSRFDPVLRQISKVFELNIFKDLDFKIIVDGESQQHYALSKAIKVEDEAGKYLSMLRRNFPCAFLKRDQNKFHLSVPDLEKRLKDLELGLLLRNACADSSPCDATFEGLVQQSLNCGCLHHAGDKTDKTALHRAVSSGNALKVQVLLKVGADVSLKDKDGNTALHNAAQQANTDIIIELLRYDAEPDVINKRGESPADLATNDEVRGLITKVCSQSLNP